MKLQPPLDRRTVRKLQAGDRLLISGTLITARDQAHLRLVEEENPGFDLEGAIIYYVGPPPPKPGHQIGSSGPTSAYRMDQLAIPLLSRGVRGMIGKGERSAELREALETHEAVYLIATGGAGALLASRIKKRVPLLYEDLGPEAVYRLEVEDFPCYVAYDVHGNSIFGSDRQ